MFGKLFTGAFSQTRAERRARRYRDLIRREASIGGKLFGEVPKNGRREFFCLNRNTWVWHEEWDDAQGHHAITTRYDVRPQGIFKAQDGQPYQPVSVQEGRRLYKATSLYNKAVKAELYSNL
ncbi:MAG TPA: hypothetical protein VLF62_06610 [Candidatus Saccharimonadales bacterium]|nr:hypothetical protein [Candidatus Saccharimonadales bacterium]